MSKAAPKLLVMLIVLALLAPILENKAIALSFEEIADGSIERAEDALVSAYQAVLEAEEAGADVSGLLNQLDDAGDLLAEARNAYRLGDFDGAAGFADLCVDVGGQVRIRADQLRGETYGPRIVGLWWTIIGSLAGVFAVAFGSFYSWRAFKRRYYRRILRMKPELAKDES